MRIDVNTLPALRGTDKQISWATDIRKGFLDRIEDHSDKDIKFIMDGYIDAGWWIANRYETPDSIRQARMERLSLNNSRWSTKQAYYTNRKQPTAKKTVSAHPVAKAKIPKPALVRTVLKSHFQRKGTLKTASWLVSYLIGLTNNDGDIIVSAQDVIAASGGLINDATSARNYLGWLVDGFTGVNCRIPLFKMKQIGAGRRKTVLVSNVDW